MSHRAVTRPLLRSTKSEHGESLPTTTSPRHDGPGQTRKAPERAFASTSRVNERRQTETARLKDVQERRWKRSQSALARCLCFLPRTQAQEKEHYRKRRQDDGGGLPRSDVQSAVSAPLKAVPTLQRRLRWRSHQFASVLSLGSIDSPHAFLSIVHAAEFQGQLLRRVAPALPGPAAR